MNVRVGLVGYGYVGQTFHARLLQATPGYQLKVVASRQPDKVRADLGPLEVTTPEQIMHEELDLIVLATPNATHFPLARAALLAGKHVVVDKPFTVHLDEARQLRDLARDQDRILSVFHNRRWDTDFLAVAQALESGIVGQVVHFESHLDRYRPQVRDRWRENDLPGSGLWYDLGPHLVDQALQLLGSPIGVQATLARQREGAQTDDWFHVLLEFPRCYAVLHASMLAAGGSPRFLVHGEKGSLLKRGPDPQEGQLRSGVVPGSSDWGVDPDPLWHWNEEGRERAIPTPRGDQRSYYSLLREAVLGRGPNPVPPEQAMAVMAVLESGLQSARTGARVSL